MHEASETHATF